MIGIGVSLKSLRSSVSANALKAYAANGIRPSGLLDYGREVYVGKTGRVSDSSEIVTYGTPGLALMTDSDGFQKWNPHNLALNSATPATQNITVVSGNDYTVEITGTGSVTLSGAGTGTVTAGSPVEVTASTTTLTLTVSGSPSTLSTYRSDQGGMAPAPLGRRIAGSETYVPTTSAAVYLPRENSYLYDAVTSSWVNNGLFLESEASTNLVTYSEQFDNAAWTKNNATVTANAATAPDGTTTTDLLYPTTSGVARYVNQNILGGVVGVNNTYSVYLKPAGITKAYIYNVQGNSPSYFDLATQTVLSVGANGTVSASIEDVGNGVSRCTVVSTNTAGGTRSTYTGPCDSDGSTYVTANGTDGIYIWGAQLEAGSTPSSYIPTAGSTVTRLGQSAVIEPANNSLIEVGSELVTNGTFDTDTDWTLGAGASIAGGKLVYSGGTSGTSQQVLTGSVLSGVYAITFEITDYTSGSVRVRWNSQAEGNLRNAVGTYTIYSVNPIVNNSILVETNGAFVGTIDNISVKELSMPDALSIGLKGKVTGASSTFVGWTADADNGLLVQSGASDFTFTQEAATVVDTVTGGTYTSGINVPFNIASRHGATFINGAVDGTALTANTTPTALPDLSATDFQIGSDFMGHILELPLYAVDVADVGLEEVTE